MNEPALGVLELQSIARGIVVADAMVKRAPVRILQNHPISPGKHLVVLAGGVAEVEESLAAGVAVAEGSLVDRLFLPQAHEQLAPLIARGAAGAPSWTQGTVTPEPLEAVAIVETCTVCSNILAADAAAKAASVTLIDMRLGQGLGGKAFFMLTGDLDSVEAALDAARSVLGPGLLVGSEIIASPHADLRRRLTW